MLNFLRLYFLHSLFVKCEKYYTNLELYILIIKECYPNDNTKTKTVNHQQRCKLEPDKQNKPTINPDSSNNLPHNNNNGDIIMVTEMKKGNKAQYHGFLLGVHEYEDYMRLKQMVPKFLQQLKELKEA